MTAVAPIFSWGHVFQSGDLPLFLTDLVGSPITPAVLTYTIFYFVQGNPNPIQAGPAGRTPVTTDVGSFYVSGVAGECGQPGQWLVRWVYQESIDSPATSIDYSFFVQAAGVPCPCNPKFGWG